MRPSRPTARPLLLVALLATAACATPSPESAPPARPTPTGIGTAQFGTLRWLEGRWRGTEPNGNPFYEGYRFVNDSTIQTYSFADSTSLAPGDSGAIALRGGVASTGSDGSRWVVAELEAGRVHFVPDQNARNAFTWVRTSPDAWTATLAYPALPAAEGRAERPARDVVYPMRRLRP